MNSFSVFRAKDLLVIHCIARGFDMKEDAIEGAKDLRPGGPRLGGPGKKIMFDKKCQQ